MIDLAHTTIEDLFFRAFSRLTAANQEITKEQSLKDILAEEKIDYSEYS